VWFRLPFSPRFRPDPRTRRAVVALVPLTAHHSLSLVE